MGGEGYQSWPQTSRFLQQNPHSSIDSSERYAKLSNQRVKQMYLHTIKKVIDKTRV